MALPAPHACGPAPLRCPPQPPTTTTTTTGKGPPWPRVALTRRKRCRERARPRAARCWQLSSRRPGLGPWGCPEGSKEGGGAGRAGAGPSLRALRWGLAPCIHLRGTVPCGEANLRTPSLVSLSSPWHRPRAIREGNVFQRHSPA